MNLEELVQKLNAVDPKDLEALKKSIDNYKEIILIGNGGSNAIASHMAVDYTKFLNKKCYVPNASDLMTMIVNDFGKEEMYSKFIEYYYSNDTLVILISSSGNSKNIVEAAITCYDLNLPVIVLTGFNKSNVLNNLELSNIIQKIYVDSKNYGVVEMAHHSILHSVVC